MKTHTFGVDVLGIDSGDGWAAAGVVNKIGAGVLDFWLPGTGAGKALGGVVDQGLGVAKQKYDPKQAAAEKARAAQPSPSASAPGAAQRVSAQAPQIPTPPMHIPPPQRPAWVLPAAIGGGALALVGATLLVLRGRK